MFDLNTIQKRMSFSLFLHMDPHNVIITKMRWVNQQLANCELHDQCGCGSALKG